MVLTHIALAFRGGATIPQSVYIKCFLIKLGRKVTTQNFGLGDGDNGLKFIKDFN